MTLVALLIFFLIKRFSILKSFAWQHTKPSFPRLALEHVSQLSQPFNANWSSFPGPTRCNLSTHLCVFSSLTLYLGDKCCTQHSTNKLSIWCIFTVTISFILHPIWYESTLRWLLPVDLNFDGAVLTVFGLFFVTSLLSWELGLSVFEISFELSFDFECLSPECLVSPECDSFESLCSLCFFFLCLSGKYWNPSLTN